MAYTIKKNLIDSSKYKLKSPYKMTPKGITVHNTANDASAENEVAYMISNKNEISFHAAVDEDSVVIGIPFDRNAWHAADGKYGKGNRTTIGIEICYSKSGGAKFDAAEINAAHYIATLMKEYGFTIKDIYRHRDWYPKKNCPHRTIQYGWDRFLDMIQTQYNLLDKPKAKPEPTPKPASKPTKKKVLEEDGLWGVSTTKYTQKHLGSYADGIVSNQLFSCKQYLPNMLAVSWEFENIPKGGSVMIKRLQELVGADIDGYAGKNTVVKMQIYLKRLGFYTGPIDGVAGPKTVIAWQKYINSVFA